MEICRRESGEPYVMLHGGGLVLMTERQARGIFISLTHTTDHAAAVAVLEG
jgi:phosphopantetheinyl transferase (holo-ACP synthase)